MTNALQFKRSEGVDKLSIPDVTDSEMRRAHHMLDKSVVLAHKTKQVRGAARRPRGTP